MLNQMVSLVGCSTDVGVWLVPKVSDKVERCCNQQPINILFPKSRSCLAGFGVKNAVITLDTLGWSFGVSFPDLSLTCSAEHAAPAGANYLGPRNYKNSADDQKAKLEATNQWMTPYWLHPHLIYSLWLHTNYSALLFVGICMNSRWEQPDHHTVRAFSSLRK